MTAPSDNPGSMYDRLRPRKSIQFGLGTLVGVVVVSAVVLGILRFSIGLGLFAGFLIVVLVLGRERPLSTLGGVLLFVFVAGIVIYMLIPRVSGGPAKPRTICRSNLKQIGLALHNYHEVWGSFPPAITLDEDGKPMHSWRVLILPYLEHQAFYNAYRLDESWDGPHNRTLAQFDPGMYDCPADQAAKPVLMTNYVAVLGDETAWPVGASHKKSDFTDGLDETILVAEVAGSGIHWMEPRDLHVLQMVPTINPAVGQGISSRHAGGINILLADGSVRFLSDTPDAETVAAMLSVNGGEKFKREQTGNILDWMLQPPRTSRAAAK